MVNVRFFASLRDLVGTAELNLPLENPCSVKEIFERLARKFPQLEKRRSRLLVAVNQEYCSWEGAVTPGDQLAFFPPVSGGSC